MNQENIKKLAARLLDGSATREEEEILHRWYDDQFRDQEGSLEVHSAESKEALNRRIWSRVQITQQRTRHITLGTRLIRIAAAVIVLALAGIGLYFFPFSHTAEWITVSVPMGETREFQLPDNSTVWVNAGSSIRYPDRFDAHERKVELINGQAFFDVRENPHRPFFVKAGTIEVTVLGTSFDVKSYSDERSASVEVRSGRVEVLLPGMAVAEILRPGTMAVIRKETGTLEVVEKESDYIGAWMDGRVAFYNEPMAMVIKALERNYDVQIRTDNPKMLQSPLTIKLDKQPLGDILEVLKYIFDFHYSFDNHEKTVTITKN